MEELEVQDYYLGYDHIYYVAPGTDRPEPGAVENLRLDLGATVVQVMWDKFQQQEQTMETLILFIVTAQKLLKLQEQNIQTQGLQEEQNTLGRFMLSISMLEKAQNKR